MVFTQVPLTAFGLYRSRSFRIATGAAVTALAMGTAWLAVAVQRRVDFFQRTAFSGEASGSESRP
eukprot:350346-Pleurochrysis_carterae.AAC.1